MNLFDFSQQISQLKKEGKYQDALSYFKDNKGNFRKEQISGNEYIIADMLTCLRKSSFLDAGLKFLNHYGIEIKGDTKERVLNAYGWLLWSKYKAENQMQHSPEEDYQFEDDEEETEVQDFHYSKTELLQKIEEAILYLIANKNDFNQTLISNLFSVVLKSEKKKAAPNWKLINDFCDQFNPGELSKKCDSIEIEKRGKKIDMELASDFENWYAYKTKALMKLGQWQDCFDKSKEALEKIEKFHYSNEIWFSRRIALSKKNLGNTDETIQELESILKKKKEWFIQKELAELYYEQEEIDKAFRMSIEAINNFGPLEFKVDLLFLMGKIHQKKNEPELAFKHFSLAKLIRTEEQWKIPQKLRDALSSFSFETISPSDIKGLKRELSRYWSSFAKNKEITKKTTGSRGKVIKILNDNERGKDGFLDDDGTELYFSISSNFYLTPKITVGSTLLYTITPNPKGKGERVRILKLIS
ncbi:tetratricopeptide repeat protein [Christiangramia crocea]|uniref:Uncharacterized protein n=1 Tax=Christiangramia crocea TaxID=2904124 RepID=A0A9X1UVM5_9FLAO|nr:hypothetical protein [Gramella crocea]MCG9971150.1 hypothetical protein [Gramella crocea]